MSAPADPGAGLRIGVASPGDPTDPAAYSGAPHALLDALGAIGVHAVPLAGTLPPNADRLLVCAQAVSRFGPRDVRAAGAALHRELPAAILSDRVARVRGRIVARRLRAAGALDGVVLCGTGLRLPAGTRYVTYEDTTIRQARASYPWPWLAGTTPRDHAEHDARAAEVYAGAVACCSMSAWAARSVVEDFGVGADKVHVAGVGAINATIPPPRRDWSTARLLFVGFDWERKNGPRILRAFARLRAEQPDATLDIVGRHPALDQDGVTGHGEIALGDPSGAARLRELYARSTCFVMPSLHEPSAQAYIEAGGAGIPSIGTTNGGSATVIGDGGSVVDPLDEDAILAAMTDLGRGRRAETTGAKATAHAAMLTWPLVAERLLRAVLPAPDDGLAAFLA